MGFKKIALALLACMAVAAFAASTAQANWTVTGGSVPATVKTEKMGTGEASNLKLISKLLGSNVELTATGINCIGCSIENTPGTNHSTGSLEFTGVTAMKPASCSVANPGKASGTVTTEALTDEVQMVTVAGTTNTFDKFFPENTTTNAFVEVEFTGPECPLAGAKAPVKGFVYGETQATGTLSVSQPVKFNTASNSISGLTLGGNAATLFGEVTNELTGANAGKAFGAS